MVEDAQFDQIFSWMQSFDPSLLGNEAEVEAKFVIPLFNYLGYPEGCRRSQYSLKTYEPAKGKRGKKPTIDQIYFSTTKVEEQTGDTSLIIVEAKEPGESDLVKALEQARFYGYHLTPIFLVATNAHRLYVVKRRGFRKEERVLNVAICDLQDQVILRQLYTLLRFDVVKRLKDQLADDVTHTLYVDLMHALDVNPDLRDQLAKGDFVESRVQEGRRLTITKPKVAVVCDLPLAFGDGACRIEFSNLLLRGLTCHLTQRQILETLMTGLDTQPGWGTRRFLKRTETGSFEAQLGQATVILSEQEASELCICVDGVCHAYKDILVSTEDTLQTWDYLPVSLAGFQLHTFHILTVEPWLWDLMQRFTHEFDFLAGTSPWHIFDRGVNRLRILYNKEVENVVIHAYYGPSHQPQKSVDLLYCIEEDGYLEAEERWTALSWKQRVGPRGLWTARYTERWLINTFIPRVLEHYNIQRSKQSQPAYWSIHTLVGKHVPLARISAPKQLVPYLHQVQGTFHIYGDCQIPAALLRPYYAAFTNLVQYINPQKLAFRYIRYIRGYVFGAKRLVNIGDSQIHEEREEQTSSEEVGNEYDNEEGSPAQEIEGIVQCLREHVTRINVADFESPQVADYISSALIALLDHGVIHCGQEHLNAARDAILPLLDFSRFEERYVLRPPWE